jgi:glycosyl hydrolase family 42 (putative beta-galactosidase)
MKALLGLFCVATLIILNPPHQRVTPGIPKGVFSLTSGGGRQPIDPAALSNPDVDGISITTQWSLLEPSERVFDWSTLDGFMAQIAPTGKKILIRIGTMGGRGSLDGSTPDWVMNAVGSNTITFFDTRDARHVTIPLFWDATFLAKKKAMIAAVGARYSSNPLVKIVTASFANAKSEDWAVPDSTIVDGIPPAGSSPASRMVAAGYTHTKMVDAGKQIMDATAIAWPRQVIYTAVGRIGPPLETDLDSVARDVRDAARAQWGSSRLVIGKNSISNKMPFTPPPLDSVWQILFESVPAIAGQNLWFCYQDPTYRMNGGTSGGLTDHQILTASVDKFVSYNGKWLEIYEKDVVNLPRAISYAHGRIGQ